MLLINDYQQQASGTAIYPGRMSPHGLMYCALKMNGEAGELAEHVWKRRYACDFTANERELITKEIGDVAWYCAAICDELGIKLLDVVSREPESNTLSRQVNDMEILALQLNADAGKLAELVGKAMRDDGYGMPSTYTPGALRIGEPGNGVMPSEVLTPDRRDKILLQVDAVMEVLRDISYKLHIDLQWALQINLNKLADRKARGVLSGSGDKR